MTSKIVVNNIEPDAGISTVSILGIATATNFKTGTSNLHSTGLNVNNTFVHSTGIALGAGSTIGAVTGVTTYYGDGSQLSGITVDTTKIETGNTKVETIDTGSDGHIKVTTEGTEKFRIDSSGRLYTGGSTQTLDTTVGALHISGGTAGGRIAFRGTTTSANAGLAEVFAFWDTNKVAGMIAKSGTDTTNKDDGSLHFYTNTGSGISERCSINAGGHFHPHLNSTYDLGISGKAWRNLYVNDAHFSNEGHSNSVDGTWGSWTLQEGENDIFMINNRTGKKYAITMREVE